MLIWHQFDIIQNLQLSTIPQISFLVGTFFSVSFIILKCLLLHFIPQLHTYYDFSNKRNQEK